MLFLLWLVQNSQAGMSVAGLYKVLQCSKGTVE